MYPDRTRENQLRRTADRQGLRLVKSSRRDPNAIDYGLYALIDIKYGGTINPALADRFTCSWSLDDVEHYFT